jgi:dihydrofolate reductase
MAHLVVSMNLSLDGYIEAEGADDGSWLSIDEEVHGAFNELAAGASVFLYGRKVYEVMPPYWPDASADTTKPEYEREYGRIWVNKPKLVVSTSLHESRWNTRVVGSEVFAEVERLKRESSSYVLCYGGTQLVSTLASNGLVDEYALFVHPTALGAGAPFFRKPTRLKLTNLRRFGNGSLCLRYAHQEVLGK